jgi:hypothetical protein
VTELDYQKALLTAKIDAHRTVVGLELRAARAAFDPLGIALSFLGVDRAVVRILPPILRAVTTSLRESDEGQEETEAAET